MTDTALQPPKSVAPDPHHAAGAPAPMNELIRGALLESRQRWRHLVSLAADLAFETDASGRLVFVMPEDALGWPPGSLVGQPSELLLGDDGTAPAFNPFRLEHEERRRRTVLRRCDGSFAVMAVSASPLRDPAGRVTGTRGIGLDIAEYDGQSALLAGRLRRGEVLDRVIARVGQEADGDGMMDAALWTMAHALGADGAVVVAEGPARGRLEVVHECGPSAEGVLEAAERCIADAPRGAARTSGADGLRVLAVGCPSRFGGSSGIALWRRAGGRAWDEEEALLAASAAGIVRMILDHAAMHEELAQQARTDPLTGLLNRRAFLEEMSRHTGRLDREGQPGTLIFMDIDLFKTVNDRFGHAAGDAVLTCLAGLLRKLVRPSDLIARLGGDEFAVWLSGADHMTAAERGDFLCKAAPAAFAEAALEAAGEAAGVPMGLSVGIATRRSGSAESVRDLMKRADDALYAVKQGGRGHWRVSLLEGDT